MEQNAIEPDIRVTRERVREHERRADAGLGLDFGDWLLDAVWDLARNDLAEHPADDGEPVTEEWIRRLDGAEYQSAYGVTLSIRPILHEPTGVWYFAAIPAPLPTRGHVRRLCAALGVPLRAGEEG